MLSALSIPDETNRFHDRRFLFFKEGIRKVIIRE